MDITREEKKVLLKIARQSIQSLFDNTKVEYSPGDNKKLIENAGAFVTLTINKKLRGCIGYIISDKSLFETVADAARQAALNDPRFPSLSEKEFGRIHIEISVLSPPFKMNSYDEIVLGKHGLILEEGYRRGLLLPQVPVEHNMNKDQYLSALCEKAGLYPGYWKEKNLNISMFTATVFSESEMELE